MLAWQRLAIVIALLLSGPAVMALVGGSDSSSSTEPSEAFTPSPEFQQWITDLVRQQLSDNYEKRKNWGHQAKSFDGVSIQLDDGRLKTHRKFADKNDGQWQLYRVKLKEPDEQFDIKIANIKKLDGGKVGLEITAV